MATVSRRTYEAVLTVNGVREDNPSALVINDWPGLAADDVIAVAIHKDGRELGVTRTVGVPGEDMADVWWNSLGVSAGQAVA